MASCGMRNFRREVHCNLQIIRGNELLDDVKMVFVYLLNGAIKAKKSNPVGNMVVFSAVQGDETKGEATLGEISDYVTSEVRKQSIVINGKMQTPTLTSSSVIGDAWRNWKLK